MTGPHLFNVRRRGNVDDMNGSSALGADLTDALRPAAVTNRRSQAAEREPDYISSFAKSLPVSARKSNLPRHTSARLQGDQPVSGHPVYRTSTVTLPANHDSDDLRRHPHGDLFHNRAHRGTHSRRVQHQQRI